MLSEYSQHLNLEVSSILEMEVLSRRKGLSFKSKIDFTLSHPFKAIEIIKRKIQSNLMK